MTKSVITALLIAGVIIGALGLGTSTVSIITEAVLPAFVGVAVAILGVVLFALGWRKRPLATVPDTVPSSWT